MFIGGRGREDRMRREELGGGSPASPPKSIQILKVMVMLIVIQLPVSRKCALGSSLALSLLSLLSPLFLSPTVLLVPILIS